MTFAAAALIHGASLMSPGPDLFLVIRYAAAGGSRSDALKASAGIVVANAVFVAAAVAIAMGLEASRHLMALTVFRFFGALYLGYVGLVVLRTVVGSRSEAAATPSPIAVNVSVSPLIVGFLSTATNGKALAYFFGLVPQFFDTSAPKLHSLLLCAQTTVLSALWFCGLARLASDDLVRSRLSAWSRSLDLFFGLVVLGTSVFLVWEIKRSL